jgi:hypothetical protein
MEVFWSTICFRQLGVRWGLAKTSRIYPLIFSPNGNLETSISIQHVEYVILAIDKCEFTRSLKLQVHTIDLSIYLDTKYCKSTLECIEIANLVHPLLTKTTHLNWLLHNALNKAQVSHQASICLDASLDA